MFPTRALCARSVWKGEMPSGDVRLSMPSNLTVSQAPISSRKPLQSSPAKTALIISKPTNSTEKGWRKDAADQDTSALGYDTTEFRRPQVPDTQRQELPRPHHN